MYMEKKAAIYRPDVGTEDVSEADSVNESDSESEDEMREDME